MPSSYSPDICGGLSRSSNDASAFLNSQIQEGRCSDDEAGISFENSLPRDQIASWQLILRELEVMRMDTCAYTMKKERCLQKVELYVKRYTVAPAQVAADKASVVLYDLDHGSTEGAAEESLSKPEFKRIDWVEEVTSSVARDDRCLSDGLSEVGRDSAILSEGTAPAAEAVFQRLSNIRRSKSGFFSSEFSFASETFSVKVLGSSSLGGRTRHENTWSARARMKLDDFEANRLCIGIAQCFTLLLAVFELSQYCKDNLLEARDKVCTAMTAIDFSGNILFTLEVLFYSMIFPWKFLFKSYYFWVDVVAVVTYYILLICRWTSVDNEAVEVLALSIPCLRILKTIRRSKSWPLLVMALRRSAEPISVPILFLTLVVSIGSVSIYWIEKVASSSGESPAFETVGEAIWFSIVTVSTTGYGDVTPHTDLGKLVGIVLIGVGVCCFAMPLAVVGNCFWSVWEQRDAILLTEKLKFMFSVAGMTFADLQDMFNAIDLDGSGHMEFEEFVAFFGKLRLDIGRRELMRFFQVMDVTGQGKISFDDFREHLGMFQGRNSSTSPKVSRELILEGVDLNAKRIASKERADELERSNSGSRRG